MRWRRQEHREMKTNERTDKETTRAQLATFNNNMVTLKSEMTKLNEATDEMKENFRHEAEKLHDNEPYRYVTLQTDLEHSIDELRASITDLRNRQDEHEAEELERRKWTFDQDMRCRKLTTRNLTVLSAKIGNLTELSAKIQELRLNVEQLNNKQMEINELKATLHASTF
jgi:hypothetical protein